MVFAVDDRTDLSQQIERKVVVPLSAQRQRIVPECLFRLDQRRWVMAFNDHYGGVDDESPAHISYVLSEDHGAHWSSPRRLIDHGQHQLVFGPSLLRLRDGRVGLTYFAFDDWDSMHGYFCWSRDGLTGWSDPVHITNMPGVHGNAGQRLLQLRSGRLVQPMGYAPSETPERGIAHRGYVWWSDDAGQSWSRGRDAITMPMRGVMEPVIVELADDRLLMFIRNQLGAIHRSYSLDRGETWSTPESTGLESPESCCFVNRIEPTGDLLVVWNNSAHDPTYDHFGLRCPLTVAISRDEGLSWSRPVNIESDPTHNYSMPVALCSDTHAVFAYYLGHGHQCSGRCEAVISHCPLEMLYAAADVPLSPIAR